MKIFADMNDDRSGALELTYELGLTYLTSPLFFSQVEQLGSILSLRNPYLDLNEI